jgi:ABC-type Fe3+/spermidine/putrescine transport system ATPase subunit
MSVVVCKDLVKQFGSALAVDHVNVEIQDGEFMVFVGPSGCGKTTTLRMIGQRRRAPPPRHRHGLPELRPLPPL